MVRRAAPCTHSGQQPVRNKRLRVRRIASLPSSPDLWDGFTELTFAGMTAGGMAAVNALGQNDDVPTAALVAPLLAR